MEPRPRDPQRASPLGPLGLLTAVGVLVSGCGPHLHSRKVDVGGYRLHLACAGKGAPTVVMDSGLGDSSEAWAEVWPGVARFARVCVYDRAGLGASDPGVLPRTSQRIVDELHALLTAGRVPPRFVLVGHSFGGLSMRLYASEHPEEIAALVLVDATHEDYPERERKLRPADEMRRIENTVEMASDAARSEFESLPVSAAEIRASGPLPDVPVIVLSAGRREESPALRAAWAELQRRLARLTPRTRQVMAENSGHNIQFEDPSLVVEVIREAVTGEERSDPADPGATSARHYGPGASSPDRP